jgi:hypothetical protein
MIEVNVNLSQFNRDIEKIRKVQKKVLVDALNWTAFDARDANKLDMDSVFDNPTPWTKNAFAVKKAKPSSLKASVTAKDTRGRMKASASEYLARQVSGGDRDQGGFERLLRSRRILPHNFRAVVDKTVRRNRYGNLSKARYQKIVQQVKSVDDGGEGYFLLRASKKSSRRAPLGIFHRKQNDVIESVFNFTAKKVNYKKRLDFFKTVEDVRDRKFASAYRRSLMRQLRRL